MVKKHKFKKTKKAETNRAREELKSLEDLPLVGGLIKGLGKFVDLAEKVEEAGGEIKRRGKIKGLGKDVKGVYGFSIRSGIGGVPKIQSFGNIRPVVKEKKREIKVSETREPIVDIFDEKAHILIIAELPGVSQEAIKLNLKEDILILEAENSERKYSKEILLPAKVNPDTKETSFKNGILEIKFQKI